MENLKYLSLFACLIQNNIQCPAMPSQIPTENSSSKENNSHIGSSSPRKKRNNSTPTRKNAAEKKQILQQLVSPRENSQASYEGNVSSSFKNS